MTYIYAGVRATKDGGAGGIYRREAGGEAWEHVFATADAQALTVDPRSPDVIHAGTSDGPYRSTDRGRTWQRSVFPDRDTEVWSIAFDPGDPRTVYAGGSPVAVYRSEDGGETFRRLPDPRLPERVKMSFACRVMRIAPHPREAGELYAALEVGGAMRSCDGGESWEDCAADLLRLAQFPHLKSRIVSDTENEGMLDGHAVAATPAAPGRVFLAVRMGLFVSDDAGKTWRDLEVSRFSAHTYGRDLRVSPHDPRVLYACLSPAFSSGTGSLWRSANAGETWERFDRTAPRNTLMAVAPHPSDPEQVYFAARTAQVFGTADGGRSWQELRLPEGAGEVYALACG